MAPKHLLILLFALFATSVAQSDDELHIPEENDNQFPPDNHSELDVILEGSGAGVIEEPHEATTENAESLVPLVENVQLTSTLINNEVLTTDAEEHSCPKKCVCNIEGNSNNYIVDCSGVELTELPKPLNPKTTELNLQNNKLTEIPKDISELKDLKILNVNNNELMDIVAGSISELPELTSLKLGNNRLMEYPTDLKNSFGLTKLEELDLGGNDMRTGLKPETFSNFKALRKLILPSNAAELAEDVCAALKQSLETVCTGTCNNKSFDCPDAPDTMDDDLLDFALPGLIALGTVGDENEDPVVSTTSNVKAESADLENIKSSLEEKQETTNTTVTVESEPALVGEATFRSAIIKASGDEPKPVETESASSETDSTNKVSVKTEGEVVGATTSNTKTGGVDKSVIGIIVAGMVLVVAGITIKKNWSSISNRFSSSPRTANDRTNVNANGTAPEEVPLQEKSPV